MAFAPQHILVPVAIDPDDDFHFAEASVLAACDIAEKFNARITLLNLASTIAAAQPGIVDVTGHVLDSFMDVLKARYDFGRLKLAELQEAAQKRGIKIEGRLIDSVESTPRVIVDTAAELNVDLLVISSHGRRGLSKIMFGSVAEKIMELTSIPVLLLHPQQTQTKKADTK